MGCGYHMDGCSCAFVCVCAPAPPTNPDPTRFSIIYHHEANGHVALRVRYPGCINYEGSKILVYLDTTFEEVSERETLDPHFSVGFSPFARFKPDKWGWKIAKQLIDNTISVP